MSKYTTGEIAKLCDITVRAVQFYDNKGLLSPSEKSEGGRRLYSEEDLKKLKYICMLKSIGIKLDAIKGILKSDNADFILTEFLSEQETTLKKEIEEKNRQLKSILLLKSEINTQGGNFSKTITDIEQVMENKKKHRAWIISMIIFAVVMGASEIASIVVGIVLGNWLPTIIVIASAYFLGAIFTIILFKNVVYICPECHEKFKPKFWQVFFAMHMPKTRKLTCTKCGKKDWCIECFGEKLQED